MVWSLIGTNCAEAGEFRQLAVHAYWGTNPKGYRSSLFGWHDHTRWPSEKQIKQATWRKERGIPIVTQDLDAWCNRKDKEDATLHQLRSQ